MPEKPDPTSSFLFVALIVRDAQRRRALAAAIAGTTHAIAREFGDGAAGDASAFARLGCDVAIVDLDDDIEQALRIIGSICSRNPSTTVMACSGKSDLAVVRRAMHAGARDFLAEPLQPGTVREALARVSSRRTYQEKAPGKLLVYVTSKGGVGVTCVAANFAIALTKESGARVVLVDMDLQLGDMALGLGVTVSCSVADALRNTTRLDRDFLSTLLIRHQSGLNVLGSPEDYSFNAFRADEGAGKMFRILREEFDYVVVDSGTCHGKIQEELLESADTLYLVTELTYPALRNSHRLISCLSTTGEPRNLQVVLNRFDSPRSDIDEARARKAIGHGIDWRIPNGHAAVRKAWDNAVPLAMDNSPVAAVLKQMARAACGKPLNVEKTGRVFGLFDAKIRAEPAEAGMAAAMQTAVLARK